MERRMRDDGGWTREVEMQKVVKFKIQDVFWRYNEQALLAGWGVCVCVCVCVCVSVNVERGDAGMQQKFTKIIKVIRCSQLPFEISAVGRSCSLLLLQGAQAHTG